MAWCAAAAGPSLRGARGWPPFRGETWVLDLLPPDGGEKAADSGGDTMVTTMTLTMALTMATVMVMIMAMAMTMTMA